MFSPVVRPLRSPIGYKLRGAVLAGVAAVSVASALWGPVALAKGNPEVQASIALSALPAEARQTHRLILSGGPFPYAKDGVTFGNRERRLPRQARGFYHEYTVPTPGAHDRGARRLICGGEPPSRPEVCYFTADHYATFQRVAP